MKVTRPNYDFVDRRGWIKNLVLHAWPEALDQWSHAKFIGGVELIRTLAGEVRSEHWHKTDWHYLYVLSGSILYQESENTTPNWSSEITVPEGMMVFTPPGVAHRVKALEDTLLISVSHLPRDHETHEGDLVRL